MTDDGGYWQRLANRGLSRRGLLRGSAMAGAGLAGAALIGCGSSGSSTGTPAATQAASGSGGSAATAASAGAQAAASGDNGSHVPSNPADPALAPDYASIYGGTPKSGGTLHLVLGSDPGNYNPIRDAGYPGLEVAGGVLSNLVRANWRIRGDVTYEGDLAQAMPEQPDQQTYVFKLRPNAKWHNVPPVNGRALTSEDVKKNFEYMVTNQADFVLRPMFTMVDKVDTPDDTTVTVHTSFPYSSFIDNLADCWAKVIPQEQYEGNLSKTKPVGSGPFIFDSFQTGVQYKLKRNPDYYRQGRPYLDGLTWHVINNSQLAQSSFLSGQVDSYGSGVAQLSLETIKRKTDANWSWRWSVLNPLMINNQRKPFDDERVRQAIMYAVDQDAIRQLQFGGYARQGQHVGLFHNDVLLEDSELPKRDVAKAKQLLSAAGVENLTLADKTFQGASQAFGTLQVQQALKDAGIAMSVDEMQWANWRSRVYGIEGDFEITMGGEFDYLSLDRQLYNSYYSKGAANNRHVNDAKLDKMLDDARGIFDKSQVASAYKDIQRYLYAQAINVPLADGVTTAATDKKVKGWFWGASAGVLFGVQWFDSVWLNT